MRANAACRTPQLQWFADSAFNVGRAAAADGDAMSAAVLFSASGKFASAAAAPTMLGLTNQRVRSMSFDCACCFAHACMAAATSCVQAGASSCGVYLHRIQPTLGHSACT